MLAGPLREAVGFTHGRHDDELERHVQVRQDAAQHRDLLRVLRAEVRAVGTHGREQLHAHRRDAAEMAGAQRTLVRRADRAGIDRRREPGRVHRGDVGRVEQVDAGFAQRRDVVAEAARIAVEVLGGAELQRVDEDRRRDRSRLGARALDERKMPGVQRAHGRHQPDRALHRFERRAGFRGRPCDPHVRCGSREGSCGR